MVEIPKSFSWLGGMGQGRLVSKTLYDSLYHVPTSIIGVDVCVCLHVDIGGLVAS